MNHVNTKYDVRSTYLHTIHKMTLCLRQKYPKHPSRCDDTEFSRDFKYAFLFEIHSTFYPMFQFYTFL